MGSAIRSDRGAARYCVTILGSALLVLSAAAAMNAVVDPFDMYRLWTIQGVNTVKPSVYNRVRLFKAFEVRRVRPQSLVLGSSRAHVGFRCSHEAWTSVEGPCYNLAFDGATTREMYAYLRHAQSVRPLSTVLLALDTYHLAGGPAFVRPDFDPLVLFDPDRPRILPFITGDLRLLTTFDTLRASLDTVRRQDAADPQWFAADGQRLGDVFFREVDATFRDLGPGRYFDDVNRAEIGYQTEGLNVASAPAAPPPAPDPEQSSFAYIRRIVDFCLAQRITLHIVVTPAHVYQYEIASAVGAWPGMQEGKRRLVHLVDRLAAAPPDLGPPTLWDFSGYSSVTVDPPPADASSEMRFYWDSSHFKSGVGDFVLDRIFAASPAARGAPADFGVRLTAGTIDRVLANQDAAQSEYQQRHPEQTQQIRSAVAAAIDRTGS